MQKFFRLALATLTFSLISSSGRAAESASFDLSQKSFADHKIHTVNEKWDIYWGELLTPEDLASSPLQPSEQRAFINMDPLKSMKNGQSNTARFGTFHAKFELPDHTEPYAIFLPEIRGATRVWMNGKEMFQNGVVSAKASEEKVYMVLNTINIEGGVKSVDLVIQNSSHAFGKLGPFTPLKIGPRLSVDRNHWHAMLRDVFTLSAILIMSFYHFALYIVRGKGVEPVLFALFCLSMSVMTLTRSEGALIFLLVADPNTPLLYRIEFLAFPLSVGLMGYYAHRLYPQFISRRLSKIIMTGSGIFMAIVAFGPLKGIDITLIGFQVFTLTAGLTYIACLCRAAAKKADGAWLFLAGFLFILVGAVNDIMKTNAVIDTPSISHMTLFCFILFQSIILSKRFSQAFTRLEEAEGEIRGLNTDLEKKVQDRTATIRMILDNVKSGFLLIDANLKIQNGFTRSCEEILEHKVEVGQPFSQLFSLTDRQRGDLEVAIIQVFDDIMPESVTLSMIKSRLPVKNRQVMLQSAVIRDEQQKIQSILITVTDATHLAQMEKEAKLSQTLVKILQAMVNFKSLLGESFQDLERSKSLLSEPGQKSVKMILHTIKGNFGSFGLEELAHSIHQMEDKAEVQAADIEELVQNIHQFLESYKDILKIDPASLHEKSYRLQDHHLVLLNDRLRTKGATNEILDTYSDWMEEIKQISFDELIGPIGKKARRIGETLGKKVSLIIEGGHIPIDADRLQSVVHSLIHLVRNSIDHGLEFPEERGTKSEVGQIFIKVWRTASSFHIEAGDDGRGINPELIKKVALNKGLIKPEEAKGLNDQEALSLIFRSGFSTRDEVTSLSGRGVGMSAIETAVLELGGRITIQTRQGNGTSFHIEIPEVNQVQERRKSA